MKLAPFILTLTLAATAIADDQRLYLASGGKMTVFEVDEQSGEVSPFQVLDVAGVGPFTFSPDGKRIYATANQKGPALATLTVQADGQLAIEHVESAGMRAGYLSTTTTNSLLAGSNYGEGRAAVWRIEDGIAKGETAQFVDLEKNAHSAVFSPDDEWLLVPATGPDRVFVQRVDADAGAAVPNTPPSSLVPEGEDFARQPRHLVFHPNGEIIYTTNERELPGVGVWKWDAENGVLTQIQNLVSQPEGFEGNITTADLHLTPDNRFLYISNRDTTTRNSTTGVDSIVGFRLDEESGLLTMIGHFPCEHIPRSFSIGVEGRFVFVSGQGDKKLGVYAINQETGELTRTQQIELDANPVWVEAHRVP